MRRARAANNLSLRAAHRAGAGVRTSRYGNTKLAWAAPMSATAASRSWAALARAFQTSVQDSGGDDGERGNACCVHGTTR
jgi:hypothetical protein